MGYWLGQWVDGRFGTDPWGKVLLALLGFGASIKQVVRIIQNWTKETEDDGSRRD